MIETYAYARAGLLGNPSDGYFGKTIALLVRNFRARVLLYPSARLEIRPSKAAPVWENLDELYQLTRWRGYYGNPYYSGAAGVLYRLLPRARHSIAGAEFHAGVRVH